MRFRGWGRLPPPSARPWRDAGPRAEPSRASGGGAAGAPEGAGGPWGAACRGPGDHFLRPRGAACEPTCLPEGRWEPGGRAGSAPAAGERGTGRGSRRSCRPGLASRSVFVPKVTAGCLARLCTALAEIFAPPVMRLLPGTEGTPGGLARRPCPGHGLALPRTGFIAPLVRVGSALRDGSGHTKVLIRCRFGFHTSEGYCTVAYRGTTAAV